MSSPEPGAAGAAELCAALAERGLFTGRVEADGAVALLTAPTLNASSLDRTVRLEIVRVARQYGFTNVALELPEPPAVAGADDSADAPVPRH